MEQIKQHILDNLWKEFDGWNYQGGWFDAYMEMLKVINSQLGLAPSHGLKESRIKWIKQKEEKKNASNPL